MLAALSYRNRDIKSIPPGAGGGRGMTSRKCEPEEDIILPLLLGRKNYDGALLSFDNYPVASQKDDQQQQPHALFVGPLPVLRLRRRESVWW